MENKTIIDAEYKGIPVKLTFDNIYRDWMRELIDFMRKVGRQQARYSMSLHGQELLKKTPYSFFGTSMTVASQFFYIWMKDELSEATENFALPYLCKNISCDNGSEIGNEEKFKENLEYMSNLAKNDFNSILIGQIDDLYFSMWSCFEAAITSLTNKYEEEIHTKLKHSYFNKIKKFYKNNILKSITDDKVLAEKLEDILNDKEDDVNKKFPVYVSFPDRISFLLDMLENYSRDKKTDKEILGFAGALRNTVHNNGIHLRQDRELELKKHKFNLKKNEKTYFDCFQDILILVNEIFDIYTEIMKCVTCMGILSENK